MIIIAKQDFDYSALAKDAWGEKVLEAQDLFDIRFDLENDTDISKPFPLGVKGCRFVCQAFAAGGDWEDSALYYRCQLKDSGMDMGVEFFGGMISPHGGTSMFSMFVFIPGPDEGNNRLEKGKKGGWVARRSKDDGIKFDEAKGKKALTDFLDKMCRPYGTPKEGGEKDAGSYGRTKIAQLGTLSPDLPSEAATSVMEVPTPDTPLERTSVAGDIAPKPPDENLESAGRIGMTPHPETAFERVKEPPSELDFINRTYPKWEKIREAIQGRYPLKFRYVPISAAAGESVERTIIPQSTFVARGTGNSILHGIEFETSKHKSFVVTRIDDREIMLLPKNAQGMSPSPGEQAI